MFLFGKEVTPYQASLDWNKFKALADNKSNKTIIIFVFDRVENIVRKEENAGDHFLLFPQCFQKSCLSGLLKVGILGKTKCCCNDDFSL